MGIEPNAGKSGTIANLALKCRLFLSPAPLSCGRGERGEGQQSSLS
jgi:hypothetical protein